MLRRRAAADRQDKVANARPASTRAAGAGGSTSTMLSTSKWRTREPISLREPYALHRVSNVYNCLSPLTKRRALHG